MSDPFFLVWREGGGIPTVRHADYLLASREAKRLAREYPGHRFTVMVAVRGFQVSDLHETAYLGEGRTLMDVDDGAVPF